MGYYTVIASDYRERGSLITKDLICHPALVGATLSGDSLRDAESSPKVVIPVKTGIYFHQGRGYIRTPRSSAAMGSSMVNFPLT